MKTRPLNVVPKQEEQPKEHKLTKFVRRLENKKESCEYNLNKWRKKFDEDPANAFIWSRESFLFAAQLAIVSELLATLNTSEDEMMSALEEYMTRTTLEKARRVEQSTPPQI